MIDGLLIALSLLVLVPMAVLVAELLLAMPPLRPSTTTTDAARPNCAVLLPAHNEAGVIGPTLATIVPQLRPGDRLVVVADNCTDQTATEARANGATVLERTDVVRRGKGFALDFGVRFLEADPPAVVVLIDADCTVHPGSVDALTVAVMATGRPVQGVNHLDAAPGTGTRGQLSAFAFLLKNTIRPRAIARLRLPSLLTGTGMAFPWPLLRDAPLATDNLTEDIQLGIDLTIAGHAPRFCPNAKVSGLFPADVKAAISQRKRWEHGHLQTWVSQVPRLCIQALRQRRLELLGLALDVGVPPLSLLFLVWSLLLSFALTWWCFGGSVVPVSLLSTGMLSVLFVILLVWLKFGRSCLSPTALLAAPFYVLWKVPIHVAFLFHRQRDWVRTERDVVPSPEEKKP